MIASREELNVKLVSVIEFRNKYLEFYFMVILLYNGNSFHGQSNFHAGIHLTHCPLE